MLRTWSGSPRGRSALKEELQLLLEGLSGEEKGGLLRNTGLPSMRALADLGRPDLVAAIKRHGGVLVVSGRMGPVGISVRIL